MRYGLNGIRLNSMDALRSFAILIVLVGHIVLGYGSPAHLAPLQLGGMGVDLFFVLSGWLLGCQLFKEMDSGTIQVKRFWSPAARLGLVEPMRCALEPKAHI